MVSGVFGRVSDCELVFGNFFFFWDFFEVVLLGRVCRVRVCSLELLPLAGHRIQLEWAKIVKLDSIYSIVYQRISVFFFF